ncbi:Hypothetical predicted protein, partial [Paramuricea clavata]
SERNECLSYLRGRRLQHTVILYYWSLLKRSPDRQFGEIASLVLNNILNLIFQFCWETQRYKHGWNKSHFTRQLETKGTMRRLLFMMLAAITEKEIELTQGRILKDDIDYSTGCGVIFEVSMRRGRLEGVLRKSTPSKGYFQRRR